MHFIMNYSTKLYKNKNMELNKFNFKGDDIITPSVENKVAVDFSWLPPTTPITVQSIDMNIPDESNGTVNIIMSNGDKIDYKLVESRKPVNGQVVPPFWTFSFKVNGKELTQDLDEVLTDGNSMTSDILNYYVKNHLNI